MKSFFVAVIAAMLLAACEKNSNAVLIDKADVTVLHSTCVKTIFKINIPNTNIGVTWSDTTQSSPIVYQQVFEAGNMKNIPVEGLQSLKPYKIKIYTRATGPDIICYLFDAVNSPSARYDVEFLP
jgi:ABC-type hemin transport system substrate-binding protein